MTIPVDCCHIALYVLCVVVLVGAGYYLGYDAGVNKDG